MYASSAVRRPALGLGVLFTAAFTTITTETLPMGLLPAYAVTFGGLLLRRGPPLAG